MQSFIGRVRFKRLKHRWAKVLVLRIRIHESLSQLTTEADGSTMGHYDTGVLWLTTSSIYKTLCQLQAANGSLAAWRLHAAASISASCGMKLEFVSLLTTAHDLEI